LVLIPVDHDVNASFVATLPDARRRGLASALVRVALVDAREQGFLTARPQATPVAERLYGRLGFKPVGRGKSGYHNGGPLALTPSEDPPRTAELAGRCRW